MASRQLAAIVVLLGVAFGFAPIGAGWPEPLLIDPAGDAFEATPSDLVGTTAGACYMTFDLPPQACEQMVAPEQAGAAGAPAPPGRDIVALRMSETPTDLVVEVDVVRLDTGMADALPHDGTSVWWDVCWNNDSECASAYAARASGRIGEFGSISRFDATCGDGMYCVWPVNVEFKAGTPGTVRLEVPRVLLSDGQQGATLESANVYVWALENVGAYPAWSVTTPLRTPGGHFMAPVFEPDAATGARPFVFQTVSESTFDSIEQATSVDEDGDVDNPERVADIDVRTLSLQENETAITFSIEMGRVDDAAPSLITYGLLGFSNGPTFTLIVDDREERRHTSLTRCGDPGCSFRVQAAGVVDVVTGQPGWINLTLRRADLGYPPAGTLLTEAYAFSVIYAHQDVRPNPAISAEFDAVTGSDGAISTPYFALRLNGSPPPTEGAAEQPSVVIRDVARDVSPRNDIDVAAGMYDLVLTAAQGTSPTTTRVTIGVRDLSRLTVPIGWKAIVYTAAFETERGNYIAGFYRDTDNGAFFCASDTLVLTEARQDPAESAWTLLEGVLSVASGTDTGGVSGNGGAGGPSTLTVFVPHSCFGTEAPGEIQATSLIGSIHLIPQSPAQGVPLEEIWLADEARDDTLTAFALGTSVPTQAKAPWYAQPLGIVGFWDIAGIALAILLPIAGVVAFRRKGSALHRYNEQIDRVLSVHANEAKARELALIGIRRKLRDDMVHARIREAHYLLVDARLAEQLKQTRLHELTDAFGDLPHRLLQKLLEILADGTITRDEARRFSALLEDAALTTDAKHRIRRKVDLWVVGDSAAASA